MSLKSQLSGLMPVAEACAVLGEDRVSRVVYGILKLQQQQPQAQQALASATKQQLEQLELSILDETAALVQSMLYTTNTANKKPPPAGDSQAKLLEEAMRNGHKAHSMSMDGLASSLSGIGGGGGGGSSHGSQVEQHIPPPIRACWKRLASRPLLLDKMTMIKFLVPASAQPHPGPGGHMGLFDCLTYALQGKASSAAPTSVGGLTPPPLIGIPDMCIFFAICHKYWLLQTGLDDSRGDDKELEPVIDIVSFDTEHPSITSMAQWMFLVYDAYQKKGTVPRDTVHRFLSDVYGEESYKTSPMVDVLHKVFQNPNSPLTSREFVKAMVDTMSYSPLPSHFMLDWMASLAEAMMPPANSFGGNGRSGNGSNHGSNNGLLPESTTVFLQTMEQQRRWLPQICDQYHLADHRLYEIKRRFHSLVESSTAVIQGDPMGEESGCGAVDDGAAAANGNVPVDATAGNGTRPSAGALPKHVIPAAVFYQKVCSPSDELGHGGYLPHSIAEKVFESMAKLSSTDADDDELELVDKEEEKKGEEDAHGGYVGNTTTTKRKSSSRSYWDLAHVLQFGGMCVRSEDDDEAMLTWIMQLFSKRGQSTLNRAQIADLLVCLCDHKEFRKLSDRHKGVDDDSEAATEEEGDGDDAECLKAAGVMVNAPTAFELRLLPESYAKTVSNATSRQTSQIPVDTLVDHLLKSAKSKNDTLSREQFFKWHKSTKVHHQHRAGPFIMELRLIASVLFGVPPKLASMEHSLVLEVQDRHKKRYPQTDVSRRGPRGTVWYVIDYQWYRTWNEAIEKVSGTKEDGEDLRDKASGNSSPRRLSKISNKGLLRENGSLALRADIRWQKDYDILSPLAWSALQAWYDGGPPIYRTVVPYSASPTGASTSPHARGRSTIRTENEIELYPFYVTIFLSDSTSRGEARPFQQAIPVSRVNPIRVLLVQLCRGLDVDPNTGRLWVMETVDPELSGQKDWLLDLDSNIVEQRKNRIVTDASLNINLLLELKDEETGLWPRGIDGKSWTFKKGDPSAMEIGDGIVGLYNMGNTCYLNSSIQCLSHTPIFRDYFTSKCYLNDINTTNPLGYEGHLAQVSAVLMNNLWKRFNQQSLHQPKRVTAPGSYAPVNAPALTPKTFKDSLGKFNEHFAGNEQHDAQELLAFLLGGLSEDLNRIQEKPYIQAPDSDGRPDSELADIWWSNHLKREMSIIVAMFTGQYKSLLRCKTCKYESARFEPFSFLQVPLPEDDSIPVSLIFYPCVPGFDIMKYSVRVHNNGTLYDVLISLAKVLHADDEKGSRDDGNPGSSEKISGSPDPENEAEKSRSSSIYSKIAQNMAVVDMREGYIFKIAPNAWRLPDLQNKDTGELPMLHVYKLNPAPENCESKEDGPEEASGDNEDDEDNRAMSCAFLALAQRRSELVARDLIHPLTHRVFGTPLLLRIPDLDGLTGNQVYDVVAKHLQSVVPPGALKFLSNDDPPPSDTDEGDDEDKNKTKEEMRQSLQKTFSDMEEVAAGHVPRYGFRLRLTSRDGRRCGICPWYECCIGCLLPDNGKPTVVANGDSIAIDWHFAVDVATSGFGTRVNQADAISGQGGVFRGRIPGVQIKNHSSCGGAKKKGHAGAITLEDCLDAFAKEEKIPEAYCSKCKDFRVQTKRMSLWRLPPVVIIHLKRFQFTQHMRRKLRDFVCFPVEGLDLSRIMAKDNTEARELGKDTAKGNNSKAAASDGNENDDQTSVTEENRDEDPESCSSHLKQDDGRSEMLYDLYGVVHHQGALSGGHYVASLKSEIDGQWRLFNDAQIYEIHSRDVVDSSAYILFYIRRDVASQKLSDFWDVRKRDGEGLTEEEMDKLIKGRSDRCVIS